MLIHLHAFRRHARGLSLLALLAICLQLAAMGISNLHALERLSQDEGQGDSAIFHYVCTATGIDRIEMAGAEGDAQPTHNAPSAWSHCPFCVSSASVLLPTLVFSFAPPEPATHVFLPRAAAGFQPSAPDLRHAPPRAPPVSLA
jgi:hypothetical protein